MSEAFVKTFKRDYLRISPLPDAPSVLRQIAGWIDDYNEIHPHSALRMRSPKALSEPKPSSRVSGERGALHPLPRHLSLCLQSIAIRRR